MPDEEKRRENMKKILRKTMGWCMALCVMAIWAMPASRQLYFLPEHISLDPGEKLSMQLGFPLTAAIGNDQIAETRTVTTGNPVFSAAEVQLTAQQAGQTERQATNRYNSMREFREVTSTSDANEIKETPKNRINIPSFLTERKNKE